MIEIVPVTDKDFQRIMGCCDLLVVVRDSCDCVKLEIMDRKTTPIRYSEEQTRRVEFRSPMKPPANA